MKNIGLLLHSVEYIEANLKNSILTEEVAAACFCSKSTLEKLFRCVYSISVHDYIIRRRMMLAARQIAGEPDRSVLEIAMEYGYQSNEAFTRAFKQVWNCRPMDFRKAKYSELFPRFYAPPKEGDSYIMQRKHVDINELYDLFQERKDCYFIGSDIKHMAPINEISRKAGDLAILEQMRRLTAAAGENDFVFRIGGDEFCILTADNRRSYAEELAAKVEAMNGKTFDYEGREIPLNLYTTVFSLEMASRYEEVFAGLHHAILASKA